MLQRIGSIGLVLHLGLVFLHNICNIQLPFNRAAAAIDPIIQAVEQLCTQHGLRHYAQLAGIHGCYGFYSPQVGSIYSSHLEIRDTCTAPVLQLAYPGLRHNASKIRYCTLLEALRGWRYEKNQNEAPLLARATAQSLYNYVKRQYPNKEIRLLINTIHTPSLREIRSKKTTTKKITPIYEQPTQQKGPAHASSQII